MDRPSTGALAHVPETLKSRRVALHMTLEDIAERAGTTAMTVSRVERGAVYPTPDIEEGIASALRLTPMRFRKMWRAEHGHEKAGARPAATRRRRKVAGS